MTPEEIKVARGGRTQAKAAALVEVSVDTWRSWEGGRRTPSSRNAAKIQHMDKQVTLEERTIRLERVAAALATEGLLLRRDIAKADLEGLLKQHDLGEES